MKKTTATTALAATIGLSAWTMTAAFAVAPAPAPADPAEAAPEDVQAPLEDGIVDESGATAPAAEGIVIPDWARDLENNVSCADAVGTPYQDNVLKPGWPSILDADGDGIMCESNGDDDAARAPSLDPWEGAGPPLPVGYVYPNCDTAFAVSGRPYPFPMFMQFTGPHLDIDGDGMACETNGDDDAAFTGVIHEAPLVTEPVAPAPAPETPTGEAPAAEAPAAAASAAEGSQVEEVPVGGADTGVSESPNRTGLLAGGAIAALVGGGLLLRRARQR
ncbi:hypothetical protein [Kocuria palustris]|uniref:hypothetical protein n=1 Tax=Kocuria palustris TaxID=71999 RepID=UPI000738D67E|nr:hypothetical protein [Kocuria palustris]KUG54617.1 hypothetical protein AVL60_07190 [Kocuria palustris]